MLAGRLTGDHLTDRHGGGGVLRGGMALVAAGLVAGALVDHPLAFSAGLVVAGVGAAGLFPLAFSAAATTPGVAPEREPPPCRWPGSGSWPSPSSSGRSPSSSD